MEIKSGTAERRFFYSLSVARFVRPTFPRHASISQGQDDRKPAREKETVVQSITLAGRKQLLCRLNITEN